MKSEAEEIAKQMEGEQLSQEAEEIAEEFRDIKFDVKDKMIELHNEGYHFDLTHDVMLFQIEKAANAAEYEVNE